MATGRFHKRLKVFGALVVLAATAVTARLLWLQVVRYADFRQMARRQQLTPREIRPERGLIVDRSGQPLAVNVDLFNVYAHPSQVKNKAGTASALSKCLGLPYPSVLRRLSSSENFVWIARQVPYERSNAVENLDLSGVGAYREQRRFYPDHDMAGHVLGFTGTDNQGLKGLESGFDRLLTGQAGRVLLERDAKRKAVLARGGSREPKDGLTVVTTLDRVIQHITQIELEKAFIKYSCRSASAIVMDPQTGEILAMANFPAFDPNRYKAYPPEKRQNRAVDHAFEPGSTFKIVPMAAALEEGILNEEDRIFCDNGKRTFAYGRVVTDHEKHGWLTLREVFGYSSNIGMVKVGEKLGKETLYRWSKRFGFGVSTGVDLPGEARGVLAPPEKWSGITMSSLPYGYEVSASPLQVLCAYAAIANGGTMMRPFLVKRVEDKDGHVVREFSPRKLRHVCSSRTAKRLTTMMRWVVEKGTGTLVKLEDYVVAGKTGTAHMLLNGRYSQNNYVSSFVGFVPAGDPKFVIYVSMDDPRVVYWGGYTAGPVFREVARRTLAYANVQPDGREISRTVLSSSVPSFLGLTESQCRSLAGSTGLSLRFKGKGNRVVTQSLRSGLRLVTGKQKTPLELTLGTPEPPATGEGRMPDLRGKTKRQALALLAPLGMKIRFNGLGQIKGQFPMPGSTVGAGTSCDLTCGTGDVLAGPIREGGT